KDARAEKVGRILTSKFPHQRLGSIPKNYLDLCGVRDAEGRLQDNHHERERLSGAGRTAIFHSQAILKMDEIRQCAEQVGTRLVADAHNRLLLVNDLLAELPVNEIAQQENHQRAETEERLPRGRAG